MTSLLWAVTASISWGTADFLAKKSADRLGAGLTLFWAQLLSIGFLGVLALVGGHLPMLGMGAWAWAIALGFSNTVAILLLYRSFEIGTLSLVSPIASSFPAVSLLLALIFFHEAWSLGQAAGVAVILAGTLLAAWVKPHAGASAGVLSKGVPEAVGASLVMGVTMFGLARVAPLFGSLLVTWVLRVVASVVLGVGGWLTRQHFAWPPRDLWAVVLAVSAFDSLAFVAYNQAILGGKVGLAAPITGTFALTTLLLARVFLKERLLAYQWGGIGGVLVGIGLVAWPG